MYFAAADGISAQLNRTTSQERQDDVTEQTAGDTGPGIWPDVLLCVALFCPRRPLAVAGAPRSLPSPEGRARCAEGFRMPFHGRQCAGRSDARSPVSPGSLHTEAGPRRFAAGTAPYILLYFEKETFHLWQNN